MTRVRRNRGVGLLTVPVAPLRSPRAWTSLILGVVLVGAGLGLMIDADFGVSPADALITGLSRTSGLSVGVVLFSLSLLMVIAAWALGIAPAIGTLVCFVGIAIVVDLTRALTAALGIAGWSPAALIATWILGLAMLCAGVMGIFASALGTSPYDQLVRAVALRTGRSLGFGRVVVDAMALLGALALGGSWGIGTVVILLVVPVTLNLVLPRVHRVVHPSREDGLVPTAR